MDVGFIGLGRMGQGMARSLAKAGHRVRGWNRSPVEGVEGVEIVREPAQAFDADATFTMLADDAAMRDVVLDGGLLSRARPGLVHVVCSTISVACARELAEAHRAAGVGYVSAPVLGRPDVAEQGELNVLAAGDPAAVEKAQPLLQAIGRKVWPFGAEPQRANAVKLGGNMMLAMAIGAMSEAAALARENEIDPRAFFDLMLGSLFAGAPAYKVYAPKIIEADFEPGFSLRLGHKDVSLASAAAGEHGRRMKMLHALKGEFESALEADLGDKDWSALSAWVAGETNA